MSKRTKSQLRRVRMNLAKYVFNSRYIVRNTLSLTVLVSVIAMGMGVSSVMDDKKAAKAELAAKAEAKVASEIVAGEDITTEEIINAVDAGIDIYDIPKMNINSISMLMAEYDVDSETVVEAKDMEMVAEGINSFEHRFITISEGVNVRREATTDSDIVGSVDINDIGDVLDTCGEWYLIKLADVTGYVRGDFILTGDAALAYAEDNGIDLDAVADGTYIPVRADETTEESTTEEVTTETPVTEVATTETPATEEVTTEAPATEAPTTEAPATEAPTTDTPVTEEPATEAPTTEEQKDDNGVEVTVVYRDPITISDEELNLMASIMTLECGGESYEGQLAVANVIINRLLSGSWGNTINDVVYAAGQFSTAYSPNLEYYLTNGAQSSCIQAAKDALSGTNNAGNYLCFRPAANVDTSGLSAYTTIGNHTFY